MDIFQEPFNVETRALYWCRIVQAELSDRGSIRSDESLCFFTFDFQSRADINPRLQCYACGKVTSDIRMHVETRSPVGSEDSNGQPIPASLGNESICWKENPVGRLVTNTIDQISAATCLAIWFCYCVCPHRASFARVDGFTVL